MKKTEMSESFWSAAAHDVTQKATMKRLLLFKTIF